MTSDWYNVFMILLGLFLVYRGVSRNVWWLALIGGGGIALHVFFMLTP